MAGLASASVTVNGRIIGKIDRGFVILLGVTHSDTTTEADWLAGGDEVQAVEIIHAPAV